MGVDPYLIAPTLILAMAQRLVRKICPDSGKEVPIKGSLQLMIEKEFAGLAPALKTRIPNVQSVLRAEQSAACPNGTRGRTVVMEVINVNDELENLILKGAGEDDLFQSARKNGFMSMREDAIIKAMKREIPFEEVNALGGMLIELDQDETIAAEAVAK